MVPLGIIHLKKRRGQMFILATMLIAVYIVMMTSALMNMGVEEADLDVETLREPYLDTKREIQNYLELILAKYSKEEILEEDVTSEILNFLEGMRDVYSTRGVNLRIQMRTDNFNIVAKQSPYGNISDGAIYTSEINAKFVLYLSARTSTFSINESFSIVFAGRVEIQDNSIIVQQSRGTDFYHIDAFSVHIFNTTHTLIPFSNPDQSGIYYFEGVNDLDNLGILNVTLMNGVHILS